jgi:uncharacterized protein YhaN
VLIERLDLIAFGHFTQRSLHLDGRQSRFHIVYGPNESGKSTTLRALTAWLFGFPQRSGDNYLHNNANLRVGGKISGEGGRTLEFVRRRGRTRTLLTVDESKEVAAERLDEYLGGLDEETFLRSFGLDRERLIAGGQSIMAGQGDVGEILFSAGAGLVQLNEIRKDLENEARDLFLPTGLRPALNLTLNELKEQKKELKNKILPPSQYTTLTKELEEAVALGNEAKQRVDQLRWECASCEQMIAAFPLVQQRDQLIKELLPLRDTPRIDPSFVELRRTLESELAKYQALRKPWQERLESTDRQLVSLRDQSALLALGSAIERLAAYLSLYQTEKEEVRRLQNDLLSYQQQQTSLLSRMALEEETLNPLLELSEIKRSRICKLADTGQQLRTELANLQRQIIAADQENKHFEKLLASIPQAVDLAALDAILSVIDNPDVRRDEIERLQAVEEKKLQQTKQRLQRVIGISSGINEALGIRLPDESSVRDLADRWRKAEEQYQHAERLAAETQQQAHLVRVELESLVQTYAVPSEAELRQARDHRDRLLDDIASLDLTRIQEQTTGQVRTLHNDPTWRELRSAVLHVDQLVDRLRSAAEHVATRSQLEHQLSKLNQLQVLRERERSEADAVFAVQRRAWENCWQVAGIECRSPREMNSWFVQYEEFRTAAAEWKEACDLRQHREADIAKWRASLIGVLQTLPPEWHFQDVLGLELSQLAMHARRLQELERERSQQRAIAQNSVEQSRTRCTALDNELQRATVILEAWEEDWHRQAGLLQQLGIRNPEEVRQLLEMLDQLGRSKQQSSVARGRLETLQKKHELFASETAQLVDVAAPVLEDTSLQTLEPEAAVALLAMRLEHAKAEDRQRRTLLKHRDDYELQLQNAQESIMQCQARLQTLCAEVGGATPDQLPEIEQRSAECQRLEKEARETELQLQRLANGESVDDFIERIRQSKLDSLQSTLRGLLDELQEAESHLAQANQAIGSLRQRNAAMDGSGLAAEIQQRCESLVARGSTQARRFALVTLQLGVLAEAMERYRQQHQGPVLLRAGEYFRELTCGDYRELKPQFDEGDSPVLVGLRQPDGAAVPAQCMSEGTADALYLSLRLATYRLHIEAKGAMPLVIDDCLVQFDDYRAAAALRVFQQISQGGQVILFTHHRHLVELAHQTLPQATFAVHEL